MMIYELNHVLCKLYWNRRKKKRIIIFMNESAQIQWKKFFFLLKKKNDIQSRDFWASTTQNATNKSIHSSLSDC